MEQNNQLSVHILVVDDDPFWAHPIAKILCDEGYHVDIARNAKDAILALDGVSYDLVFIDIRLADNDAFNIEGLDVLLHAKSLLSPPKTILMSSYPESAKRAQRAKKYKPNIYLPKDNFYDLSKINQIVRSLIDTEK